MQLTGQLEAEEAELVVSPRFYLAMHFFFRSYEPHSVESHLQTQRSAVKMLHERIVLLIKYVTDVIAGKCPPLHP